MMERLLMRIPSSRTIADLPRLIFPIIAVTPCIVIGVFCVPTPLEAAPNAIRQIQPTIAAEYIEALRTTNAFLAAWVSRDAEAGLKLMSSRLRADADGESWLRQFMVGLSNPHHEAFKIAEGKKGGANRYIFSVTLYELFSGEKAGYGYVGKLEVVKEREEWRIDVLPKSSDNP